MSVLSPLTQSTNVERIARYEPSITSDSRPTNGVTDNYLCKDTGLLFNGAGTRGRETGFYQDEYVLHAENLETEFVHYDGGKAVINSENVINFITNAVTFAPKGRLLEVGCGKGQLLRRFKQRCQGWALHAIEPSKNATSFFAKVMPELSVFEGPFEASPFVQQTFDFVIANAVLEHVPDPVAFLTRLAGCMTDGAHAFVAIPNLETNPADLLTFDHLSKFTPNVARDIFHRVGLRVVAEAVPSSRVPMWFILKKDEAVRATKPVVNIEDERAIALRARDYVQKCFDACDAAIKAARADGTKFATFGLGTVVFSAPSHTGLKVSDIACAFDDNESLWGSERLGVPIRSPNELMASGVGHLFISANPCYYGSIKKRIAELTQGQKGPKIYLADGHG